jgi:hypothetical protein
VASIFRDLPASEDSASLRIGDRALDVSDVPLVRLLDIIPLPCMGLSMSSTDFQQRHLFLPFFLIFLFGPLSGAHPFVPNRGTLMADARRDGQEGRGGVRPAASKSKYDLRRLRGGRERSVHRAGLLANQRPMLAGRTPGIFLSNGRKSPPCCSASARRVANREPPASVIRRPAGPSSPVGVHATPGMLAGWITYASISSSQPAGQPEAVPGRPQMPA